MGGGHSEASEAETELRYFPEGKRHSSSMTAYWGMLAPAFVGGGVAALTHSVPWGLAAAGATILYARWKRQRERVVPRAVLQVVDGKLRLSGPAFQVSRTYPLEDLLDVYLDTRTIQRVQENTSSGGFPELRFINSTVGAEVDIARVALELKDETLFLTEEQVSHLDASEWSNKIRRFLRRNGWLPEDER